jgi:hypothetical protein
MSLLHLLKVTQDNASEWLQQLPVWFQDLNSVKDSLFQDEEALQAHQEQVNRNQAEIDMLDAKFEDLTSYADNPSAQHNEL